MIRDFVKQTTLTTIVVFFTVLETITLSCVNGYIN